MKENPYLTSLRNALPKEFSFANAKAYFIKGFEMSDEYLQLFENNFNKNNFSEILKDMKYSSQGNNILVFYIEDDQKRGELYLLTDSLELYEKEVILKKYNCILDINTFDLPEAERIN